MILSSDFFKGGKKSTLFLRKGIILPELVNHPQRPVLARLFIFYFYFLGLQCSYVELSLDKFLHSFSLEQAKGTEWLKSWPLSFVTSLAVLPVCHLLTRVRQGIITDNSSGALVKRKLHRGKGISVV